MKLFAQKSVRAHFFSGRVHFIKVSGGGKISFRNGQGENQFSGWAVTVSIGNMVEGDVINDRISGSISCYVKIDFAGSYNT